MAPKPPNVRSAPAEPGRFSGAVQVVGPRHWPPRPPMFAAPRGSVLLRGRDGRGARAGTRLAPGAAEQVAHGALEVFGQAGLREEGVSARLQRALLDGAEGVAREHDHRNAPRARMLLEPVRDGDSVQA